MQTQTKVFLALIIAAVVLIALALYEWPTATPTAIVPPFVSVSTTTTETSTSTPSPSSSTSSSGASSTPSLIPLSYSQYPTAVLGEQQGTVTIDGHAIFVDLDVTPAQQELGLGNRAGIGPDQGMLFIFPQDQINMFWMKDMHFSIDMIWLSADGTIIYIQPNVAPSTYPAAFGPNENSRYVLEVPANFASDRGIKVGDIATLP